MKLDIFLSESTTKIDAEFKETHEATSGGFSEGYAQGHTEGYNKGHTAGVAEGYTEGKVDGEAIGYERGHADGASEEKAACESKHFITTFIGCGENNFSIEVPFDPDIVCVVCHSPQSNNVKNEWMDLRFDRRNAGQYLGYFMYARSDGSRTNTRVGYATAKDIVYYENGRLYFAAPNATLQALAWGTDLRYVLTALKYTNKTDKELVAEEIAILPETGSALAYSLERINKIFETADGANDGSTSEEWKALVATKPNRTFTLA